MAAINLICLNNHWKAYLCQAWNTLNKDVEVYLTAVDAG